MTNKKYPLNISVLCSIGLEGGLLRYRDILPNFSSDDFDLIHEWNKCLIKTIKEPVFNEYIGASYRILLNLHPIMISRIIDRLSVPYRSYYYAKRFIEAMNFVYERSGVFSKIIDFGRGLSPWIHVINKNYPTTEIFTFDMSETDDVFRSVTKKMNLQMPKFNEMPEDIDFNIDVFVSLGTFVYLPKSEQITKLQTVSKQFKNLFIELEKSNIGTQADNNIVNRMGADYNPGFSADDVRCCIGENIPYTLREIAGVYNNKCINSSLKYATEMFLVR